MATHTRVEAVERNVKHEYRSPEQTEQAVDRQPGPVDAVGVGPPGCGCGRTEADSPPIVGLLERRRFRDALSGSRLDLPAHPAQGALSMGRWSAASAAGGVAPAADDQPVYRLRRGGDWRVRGDGP